MVHAGHVCRGLLDPIVKVGKKILSFESMQICSEKQKTMNAIKWQLNLDESDDNGHEKVYEKIMKNKIVF